MGFEVEAEREEKQRNGRNGRNCRSRNGNRDRDGNANEKYDKQGFVNPCWKHNGEHDWKDCPDNKRNKDTN